MVKAMQNDYAVRVEHATVRFNPVSYTHLLHLKSEERERGTIEKYLRDIRRFADWLQERPLSKAETTGWKEQLLSSGYQPVSINCCLLYTSRCV